MLISAQWKYGCYGLVVSITLIANEAERIYILKLFHETSCSTKSLVHTMRLVVHNAFQIQGFVNYLFSFSIIVQKNRMIPVASCVLALRYRGHANDVRSIVKILFSAKS